MSRIEKEFTKGIFSENPTFRLLLGLCPVLAVSTSVINAMGMGISVIFVLTCSNVLVSLIRKWTPPQIRIPIFISIIATFVTIVDLVMAGYFPSLHRSLGIFIKLIVVNCIILGRAEAFASKNDLFYSVIDALGMGTGLTLAMVIIASIRELLGNGTWLDIPVFGPRFEPALGMILAPGAFLTIGLLIGLMNALGRLKKPVYTE